jgi:hypothetical protein
MAHRVIARRRSSMAKPAAYEPMTLGNKRQFGMTRLDVSCHDRGAGIAPGSTRPGMPTT